MTLPRSFAFVPALAGAATLLFGAGLAAQQPTSPATLLGVSQSDSAGFSTYYESAVSGVKLTGVIEGAQGSAFAFVATHKSGKHYPLLLAVAPLDAQGNGSVSMLLPAGVVEALDSPIQFSGVFVSANRPVATTPAVFELGVPLPDCPDFSFNAAVGDDADLVAGRRISDQYADVGIMISGDNARGGGPDVVALFDSANPTGGDSDLATPNPGAVGNDTALGNLLIIAENNGDGNMDGLIDVPDDEAQGGSITYDFDFPATVCGLTLVDMDDSPGSEVRFFTGGDLITPSLVAPIITLGDGSVQRLTVNVQQCNRMEVVFSGSGAIGGFEVDTCPILLSFEEFRNGEPRNLLAGDIIDDEFSDLGVTISAINANPSPTHPDLAILFDTGNVTGGDTDLATPNPGAPGNTEALGFVLIISENNVDADMDGRIDVPDDEAAGGEIRIDFDEPVSMFTSRVLDVDAMEFDQFRLLDAMGNDIVAPIVVPDSPDGSVQIIDFGMISGVRTLILELGGSGALTRVRYCPDRLLQPVGTPTVR